MHQLQVIHGNLKGVRSHPCRDYALSEDRSNLLLKANIYVRDFQACIADFGISTIAKPRVDANTGSTPSLASFTPGESLRWMSPELLDPKKFGASDPRPTKESDLFSLGMVIYEVQFHAVNSAFVN